MEALENGIHHEHIGDTSDEEIPEEEEETPVETPDVRMFRSIFGASSGSRDFVPFYSGSLDPKELIDWINAMNKHFDYAEVKEDRQVRFVVTRLRGACILVVGWCARGKNLKNKSRINNWNILIAKLKGKFIPED